MNGYDQSMLKISKLFHLPFLISLNHKYPVPTSFDLRELLEDEFMHEVLTCSGPDDWGMHDYIKVCLL